MRRNVLDYDQRHGYRGPESFMELPAEGEERDDAIDEALRARPDSDGLIAAVVTYASPKLVNVENIDGDSIAISGAGLRFASRAQAPGARDTLRLRPGAVVRIAQLNKKDWMIVQLPKVAAAFVAIDARTGAYHALVGGFDYNLQKYNHVTQAWRQPGSSIKPFVYSAALERGFSPATPILDERLDILGANAGATWSPQNDDGRFEGQVSMRQALTNSKNVPTVRLLRAVGVDYAHAYLDRFGFDLAKHPKNLTMALGTGSVTPLQLAAGYAVFANGGHQIKPFLIAMVKDVNGRVIAQTRAEPPAGDTRVIDPRNAYLVDSMLRDVTRFGTAAAASKRLNRSDLAGKTGTTNDAVDGWFAGYGASVVGVAWMGYDDPKSLGGKEFGATLAMPIWIDYMRVALAREPVQERPAPPGLVREGNDWAYGEYAGTVQFSGIDVEIAPAPQPVQEAPVAPEHQPEAIE